MFLYFVCVFILLDFIDSHKLWKKFPRKWRKTNGTYNTFKKRKLFPSFFWGDIIKHSIVNWTRKLLAACVCFPCKVWVCINYYESWSRLIKLGSTIKKHHWMEVTLISWRCSRLAFYYYIVSSINRFLRVIKFWDSSEIINHFVWELKQTFICN